MLFGLVTSSTFLTSPIWRHLLSLKLKSSTDVATRSRALLTSLHASSIFSAEVPFLSLIKSRDSAGSSNYARAISKFPITNMQAEFEDIDKAQGWVELFYVSFTITPTISEFIAAFGVVSAHADVRGRGATQRWLSESGQRTSE